MQTLALAWMQALPIAQNVAKDWNIGSIIIAVIIIAACIAIGMVATRAMGVTIPDWVIQIFWIVVIAFIAILALRFVLTL